MNKWLEIILGLILLAGALALILPGMPLASWGIATWELIKGGVTLLVLLVGIVLITLGLSELKN